MVFGSRQDCAVCGERFEVHEERLYYGSSSMQGSRAHHFACVDYDTPLSDESCGRWASWKLQQVEEAHVRDVAVLRARTTALYNLAVRLMSKAGLEPDDIEDFRYEYSYRDRAPGEEDSGSSVEGEDSQDGA